MQYVKDCGALMNTTLGMRCRIPVEAQGPAEFEVVLRVLVALTVMRVCTGHGRIEGCAYAFAQAIISNLTPSCKVL